MARHFDGVTNRIEWGDVTIADGLSNATWTCWVKPDWTNSDGNCNAWRKDGSFTPLQRSGASDFWVSTIWYAATTANVGWGDYTWTANTWHFAALLMDQSFGLKLRTYGALKADVALTLAGEAEPTVGPVVNSANQMRAGTDDSGAGEPFAGDLAFMSFFAAALTEPEMLAIKNNPNQALSHSSCRFYARLCGVNDPEPDASVSGISGDVTGATQSSSEYDELCQGIAWTRA